jgi:hypothetical protein
MPLTQVRNHYLKLCIVQIAAVTFSGEDMLYEFAAGKTLKVFFNLITFVTVAAIIFF